METEGGFPVSQPRQKESAGKKPLQGREKQPVIGRCRKKNGLGNHGGGKNWEGRPGGCRTERLGGGLED